MGGTGGRGRGWAEEAAAAAVFCLVSFFVLLKFPTLQKWPCFELRSECLKEGKDKTR